MQFVKVLDNWIDLIKLADVWYIDVSVDRGYAYFCF